MPFSVRLDLGTEHPVVFERRIESAFAKYVPKGTAFAKVSTPDGPGLIVTNGPLFLSTHENLEVGATIAPSSVIAYGAADGEDIPYGQPYCAFVHGAITEG